ncbi:hypothetical protein MADA3029_940114 [Vibrio nigripulchritudo MADA3029]|uniref:tetratricopeptide repeat protein n=1 Tax=Vibrio nigripulchritudo TaxID=28173 RepID=UPI0003B214F9|nr:hypothetical protein [Vibrio nigripulchritudo]CCN50448.1 hypothetical protein VIBNIMADA3020_910112 [Vibrio nigripulchritudo MADA3020]CCN52399.1 hypothetical protein VIBNIMADA3021_1230112 [Vibrio nigripulchritudo MADA3021]CCN62226.1 hypothetical protein MADA3029_940114 [Vibrio nigripulchritudo MADA3029]BCL69356.1 hypothetical protein VNTUMSATTG_12930 [Vibrio nigripulchritudo]BDU30692.1 hypothetical protein TUMSATVNIG1_13010 [Vibrio nigripulchritudo]
MRLIFGIFLFALAGCSTVPEENKSAADYENQLNIAQLAEQNQQYDAALVIYNRLNDMKQSDEVSLSLGRLYYRAGEWSLAQAHLISVEHEDEFYPEARLWLAKTYLKLSQPGKSFALLENSASNSEELNVKAVSLDYLQRHSDAQKIYVSLLELHPLKTDVRKNLVYSYILSGNFRLAEEELKVLHGHGVRDRQQEILAAVVSLLNSPDKNAVSTLEEYASPMEVAHFIETLEQLKQEKLND